VLPVRDLAHVEMAVRAPLLPVHRPRQRVPVTKRSRIRPSTSSLRNSGFPWHRVHFSSEIEAEASRASPGGTPPEEDKDRRERELPHKSPSPLSFSYSSGCSSRSHSADTFP